MRDFRADRIAALISNNTPVRLREGARISLHIVPLASIATNKVLDVTEYQGLSSILSPPGTMYLNHRLNFDGIVTFSGAPEQGFIAYNQFYRSEDETMQRLEELINIVSPEFTMKLAIYA